MFPVYSACPCNNIVLSLYSQESKPQWLPSTSANPGPDTVRGCLGRAARLGGRPGTLLPCHPANLYKSKTSSTTFLSFPSFALLSHSLHPAASSLWCSLTASEESSNTLTAPWLDAVSYLLLTARWSHWIRGCGLPGGFSAPLFSPRGLGRRNMGVINGSFRPLISMLPVASL